LANLIVTGGAGFIGSNFARYWRRQYSADSIVVLDSLTYAGNLVNLHGISDLHFVEGDIRNEDLVRRIIHDHEIDTIVHFAAESHVDRSIAGPDAFIEANIVGTHSLLKAARAMWLDRGTGRPHRFHNVSTDEVYGSLAPDDEPFKETTAFAPNSPYAASKAATDHLVRAYHHTYGLAVTTSNCSNNFGPYQFPEKLIPLFILNGLHGRPLPIYGDGQQVRDWLYVEDHCCGIDLILGRGRIGETYNIGGGTELTNLTVIDLLCAFIDAAFEADLDLSRRFPQAPAASGRPTASLKVYVTDRPGHDRRYAINETKICSELGYGAARPFTECFEQTLQWFLDNQRWWSAILNGSYRNVRPSVK
jgi:dTDP-glucose 4,6-dehydratase